MFLFSKYTPGILLSALLLLSACSTTETFNGQAINLEGERNTSEVVPPTTIVPALKPTLLVNLEADLNGVSLIWQDENETADQLILQRKAAHEEDFKPILSLDHKDLFEVRDTNVLNRTQYTYRMKVTKDKLERFSEEYVIDIQLDINLPRTPTNLSAVASSRNGVCGVMLRWFDRSNDETFFVVEKTVEFVRDAPAIVSTVPVPVTSSERRFSGQRMHFDGTQYGSTKPYKVSYRVRAKNLAGNSGQTSFRTVTYFECN